MIQYLHHSRNKCRKLIAGLTEESAWCDWTNSYRSYPLIEILLYNMRHAQHHAAQLNLLLRQGADKAPRWVSQAQIGLQF